jgi:hypothetical protein
MTKQDQIGHRGEALFAVMVTRRCAGRTWFFEVMLGEKYPTIDFKVDLLAPTVEKAYRFVQVKATDKGYSGAGAGRKLNVKVSKKDVQQLRRIPAPAYVVGVDVTRPMGQAFIVAIDKNVTEGINGLPTRYPLDCRALKKLWAEVDTYWKARDMLMAKSVFSVS